MHKPFKDNAGYTRHCWECKHASEWLDTHGLGSCKARHMWVLKFDSPNNPCSIVAGCEHYER